MWATLHHDCLIDVRKSPEENSGWNCNCNGCEIYEARKTIERKRWEAMSSSVSPYAYQHSLSDLMSRGPMNEYEQREWYERIREKEMYERRRYEEEVMKRQWFSEGEEEK